MARPKKAAEEKVVRQSVSMDPEQLRQVVAYCQSNERTIAWVIKKGSRRLPGGSGNRQ